MQAECSSGPLKYCAFFVCHCQWNTQQIHYGNCFTYSGKK